MIGVLAHVHINSGCPKSRTARLTGLQTKGLLDQALVVLGTEFGRTPQINDKDGRDHHDEVAAAHIMSLSSYEFLVRFEGSGKNVSDSRRYG